MFENFIRKYAPELLGRRMTFSAADAWNLTRFSRVNLDDIIKEKVSDINSWIVEKTRLGTETCIIVNVPPHTEDFYEKIAEHYVNNGFEAFVDTIDRLGETVLIISWKNGDKDSNNKPNID